jgi:hypothetical protein
MDWSLGFRAKFDRIRESGWAGLIDATSNSKLPPRAVFDTGIGLEVLDEASPAVDWAITGTLLKPITTDRASANELMAFAIKMWISRILCWRILTNKSGILS